MSGFDEKTYEAASARLEGWNQAMEQIQAQLGEEALVSMAGEFTAGLVVKYSLENRVREVLARSTMNEAAIENFFRVCSAAAARLMEDLEAILEEEQGFHHPGTKTPQ